MNRLLTWEEFMQDSRKQLATWIVPEVEALFSGLFIHGQMNYERWEFDK